MFKDDVERCDDFSNIAGLENKTAAEKPAELESLRTRFRDVWTLRIVNARGDL